MRRITRGSTNVPPNVESSESSNKAKTKEITADASRMSTSWSLNCSRINSHSGVGSSSGSSATLSLHQRASTTIIISHTIFPVELGVFSSLISSESTRGVHAKVFQYSLRGFCPRSLHAVVGEVCGLQTNVAVAKASKASSTVRVIGNRNFLERFGASG
jgi:hypothetical protein